MRSSARSRDYELCVMHTSTPSFASDVKVAEALKAANPSLKIGLVGAKVAVQPAESLAQGGVIDFVARNEFDFTIKEIAEGRDWGSVDGISYRNNAGVIIHNKDRATLEDMDQLPFVTEVYKRDLRIEDYFIGYLMHPYVSLYTGRGCKSHCTFCLWPQTVGGHRYRVRSPDMSPRKSARPRRCSRRCGNSSSTTTPSPTTCRAPRRSRASSARWASPGRATPRRTCRARR